jgi:hypothetical protein
VSVAYTWAAANDAILDPSGNQLGEVVCRSTRCRFVPSTPIVQIPVYGPSEKAIMRPSGEAETSTAVRGRFGIFPSFSPSRLIKMKPRTDPLVIFTWGSTMWLLAG